MAVLRVRAVLILITTLLPNEPPLPASTTLPVATARTSVSQAAWKSMPVWLPEDHSPPEAS